MDIATTLKLCHRIVWEARAELEPYWPTPTTEDALLFAFTELGEAVDAHLRSKPEYARNRDKNLSVLDELADCALMLITALGLTSVRIDEQLDGYGWSEKRRHRFLVLHVSSAFAAYYPGNGFSAMHHAHLAISLIAQWPGMDLPARLTARLERIKAKRMPRGDGFAEFENFWPIIDNLPDGVDMFGQYPVSGEPVQGD